MNEEQRNTVAMNLTPISTYITENVGLFVTGDRDFVRMGRVCGRGHEHGAISRP